jgi:hypothetical protein
MSEMDFECPVQCDEELFLTAPFSSLGSDRDFELYLGKTGKWL